MLDFLYDSLDTVKHLKHPDKKLYVTLTIAIFCIVIFAGFYFILADAIFGEWYNMFYQTMSNQSADLGVWTVSNANSALVGGEDLPIQQ